MHTKADIDAHTWFHGLDFGNGLRAKGRSSPENWSLFGVLTYLENINLRDARLLDVGTMDGLVAFSAEKEGADVVATDLYDRKSMHMAKEVLRSSIDYRVNTSIETLLPTFGPASFDVIVMGGLLYHLISPMRAILIGRHLLKTGGILLMETVSTEHPDARLSFNPSELVIDEYTTYFVPSMKAVREMMQFAAFDVIASNKVRPRGNPKYVRGGYVAQAVDPQDMRGTTDLMTKAQQRAAKSANDGILDELSLAKLNGADRSSVQHAIPRSTAEEEIDPRRFQTRFPLQPR